MNELQHWLHTIHHWYQHNDCAAVAELQPLIFGAPQALWQPALNSTQSKAIACWLDACLRQFEFYRETDTEKACNISIWLTVDSSSAPLNLSVTWS
ncbi:transcriptional regulator [Vibrio cholerae]|nr:transcriptional regulator [Vibrio cholerae]